MKEKEEMGEVEERKKGGRKGGKDRLFYVHIVKRVAREGNCSFPFLFSEDNEWRLFKKKYIQEQSASSGSIRENCPASD